MNLNLGACDEIIPGYLSVDLHPPADIIHDLRQFPWPWPDSSVSCLRAVHLLEHLPDRIATMNEAWRVLKPGGQFIIEVPSASHGSGFAQDPTHCSQWCMNSFLYFALDRGEWQRFHKSYGIKCQFRIVRLSESMYPHENGFGNEPVYIVSALLEAVK